MSDLAMNRPALGIALIMMGMLAISVNDLIFKLLSDSYPLHQIAFIRAVIGLAFTLIYVQIEGGWSILRTDRPLLHALRGILIVISNMTFFVAIATITLAEATALFFVAPLFITLLSILILGERVGPLRIVAVAIGFVGVLTMLRPWEDTQTQLATQAVLILPVIAALTYALTQVLTRKLGVHSKASAMVVYIQGTFIVVSLLFGLVAGDGRFAEGLDHPSLVFLLRAWTWPQGSDYWIMLALGFNMSIVGYCLSQAYRVTDAATVAPFEYVGLPLAVFWGWLIWAEFPVWEIWLGMGLIVGAGLFVFLRERHKARMLVAKP